MYNLDDAIQEYEQLSKTPGQGNDKANKIYNWLHSLREYVKRDTPMQIEHCTLSRHNICPKCGEPMASLIFDGFCNKCGQRVSYESGTVSIVRLPGDDVLPDNLLR